MNVHDVLDVAAMGYYVLPLNGDNTPLLRHGAYAATVDGPTIERWGRSWPGANWGANTAHMLVADADSAAHKNGHDGVTAYRSLGFDVNEPITRTPRNGEHHWFARPPGVKVAARAGAIAPGVDVVTGRGRYVPLPGSRTPHGAYVALRPLVAPLPLAPARLVALAQRPRQKERASFTWQPDVSADGVIARLRKAQPGTRNDELNLAAYLFGRLVADGRIAYGEAQALLMDVAGCIGLGVNETQHTVHSGLEAGSRAKGALPVADSQRHAYDVLLWAVNRGWPGRTGSTDRRIAIAHCMIALQSGQDVYDASVRRLAELAGVGTAMTATNANRRLVAQDVITVVEPGKRCGFTPGAYALAKKRQECTYTQEQSVDGERQMTPTDDSYRVGAQAQPVLGICTSLSQSHDVWRYKGLGAAAGIVYEALQRLGTSTTADIAEHTGQSRRTVERALKRLTRVVDVATGEVAALVVKDGRRYTALEVDLNDIARLLHVDGEGERQRARHEREREEHVRSWEIERRRRREGTLPQRSGTAYDRAQVARLRKAKG